AQFIGENNKLTGTIKKVAKDNCQVQLDDGTMLVADPVNVSGEGGRTTVSLRPERIEIDPDKSVENNVQGKIEELIYLGDHIRVRMNVAGNDEFIVKVRNRRDKRPISEGDTVAVGWAASDCKALDAVA
ncbi:MAG: TOBE domain-containing protein, partial [Pseudomonadota bacterium]